MKSLLDNPTIEGVNVIGYFGRCFGVAQSARFIVSALQTNQIPFSLISADALAMDHPANDFSLPVSNQFTYPINIFCLDHRQIPTFIENRPWDCFKDKINIGLIFWETNRFPKDAKRCWRYLDEVWTTTRYVQEHVSIDSLLPVYRIPQPVSLPDNFISKGSKNDFGLKDHFTFLFLFSFASVLERKNPMAIIDAFQKAFPNHKDVQLVIKSQNGDKCPNELNKMLHTIKDDPRIIWIDKTMDLQATYDLINACDCYVSLHRSEGFGLTLAEAMLLGKPTIATGYSGNMDFMNEETGYLCHYKLKKVGEGNLYPPDGMWADVDTNHAAYWMKHVFYHRDEAQVKAKLGREFIIKNHSCDVAGQNVIRRLNHLELRKTPKPVPWQYRTAKSRKKKDEVIHKSKRFIKQAIKKALFMEKWR